MITRIVLGITVALAMSCTGFSQQAPQGSDAAGAAPPAASGGSAAVKQQLQQKIAASEAAVRQAETAHATDVQLARRYWNLGFLYEDAAEWGRSEAALAHSVSLFRRVAGDDGELATALNSLAVMHIGMGKYRNADKEEHEALQLREKLGDRLQLAECWNAMAALSLKQHKYEQAHDFALKAASEFRANAKADETDRISSQYSLGMSLCGLNDCVQAAQVLKAAVDEARAKLPAHDFSIGAGRFLLGLAYWKAGDMANAGQELQAGVTAMNEQLGWGHPSYVASLELYAKYLHQANQIEAANDVERQIHQAEAVVDVHTLQSGPAVLSFDGLR